MSVAAQREAAATAVPARSDLSEAGDLATDLVWLEAQQRALESCADESHTLAERLRSCGQVSVAIDDLVRLRGGREEDLAHAGRGGAPDAERAEEMLAEIQALLHTLAREQDDVFMSVLGPGLADAGIHLIQWDELEPDEQSRMASWFERRIFPVLTPLAVDPGHPFPHISDLSLNLAVVLEDPATGRQHFARVKVPGSLNRFVGLPDSGRFVPLEQVIVAHLGRLFPGMTVRERHPFRVTRDGGVRALADTETRRSRAGRAVRLEVHPSMPADLCRLLQRELDLGDEAVTRRIAPIDLSWLASVADLIEPSVAEPERRRWPLIWGLAVVVALIVVGALVLAFR